MQPHSPSGTVIVSIGRERYQTKVLAGGHELVVDEPADAGGGDRGPTPYGLLLGALGSCKAITARMYADRKGWDLREVVLTLRHERRHDEDCQRVEGDDCRLTHVEVEMQLVGDLSDDQRRRLHEIADRCPVHRTLSGEIAIATALVDEMG